MRLTTACRVAIIAATCAALSIDHSCALGQSLFNSRAPAGQNQASATSKTGSMFPSNIGFSPSANTNAAPVAGGAFVGRSNREFVGGRAASQSVSGVGENSNANRRAAGSQDRGAAAVERAAVPPGADSQREATSNGVRRRQIVPRHRIAFAFPAKQPDAITGELSSQLANLAARYPEFAHITVLLEPDGLVKLQGQVPSDDTRRLAAIIVGLEPGVRNVQNELAVADDPG